MKFRAHETFFIRKGWLYKGLKNVIRDPSIFTGKQKNPVDVLGIGTNMVKSLRYWLQATCLTTENQKDSKFPRIKVQTPTEVGEIIFDNDRYFEEIGTICIVHYLLASNKDLAPAWYYFFNEFELSEFNKEDFVIGLSKFAEMNNEHPALSSLEDDFNCLINTYVLRKKLNPTKVNPESNIECPLDELGLIEIADSSKGKDRVFKKAQVAIDSVSPYVFFALINKKYELEGKTEIKISELLLQKNSIGKLFNLDILALSKILDSLEKLNLITVIRTAGLDVIKLKKKLPFYECLKQYYKSINGK